MGDLTATDGPVEFGNWPVQVQDFRQIGDHFKGIYRIYLKPMKEKIPKCNRLDLKTLGS